MGNLKDALQPLLADDLDYIRQLEEACGEKDKEIEHLKRKIEYLMNGGE